jgi:hypothetical protein
VMAGLGRRGAALMFACALTAQDDTPYPQPASRKGLQVQMVDDALALGIHHAALNVDLVRLALPAKSEGALAFACDGADFWFDRAYAESLDAQIAPLSAHGVVVSLILLACQSGDAARDALLVHPDCRGRAPNGIAAFDTVTERGRAQLRAAVAFLAARYSENEKESRAEPAHGVPGSGVETPHGRVWNWIVGNEVNSHWWWYHLGHADVAHVAAAYADAVRIVHDAVRTASAHGRVFVSLEHHWTIRCAAGDATQSCPGRELLLAFAARVRAGGDFDWHVAFHPYPENLFECRFWRDTTAPDADDAPRVTFRNLPVLARFLARDELRWHGEPRRVILSEQGFHCRADADGERDQAAAFALAWHLVQQEPGIDAFLLHRHVDHAHEGGLCLGLWTRKPDSVCEPEHRRRIYELFRDCDTERWPEASAFALPVIGIERWSDWPVRAGPAK